MTADWSISSLLADLASRGVRPAILSDTEDGLVVCDGATLADNVLRLAAKLRTRGFIEGSRVGLWAPNSAVWIASALAVLASGAVLVPLDDLLDASQLEDALAATRLQPDADDGGARCGGQRCFAPPRCRGDTGRRAGISGEDH